MTLPRELKLTSENGKYILISEPVVELQKLHEQTTEIKSVLVKDKIELDHQLKQPLYPIELDLKFTLPQTEAANDFGIELYNSKDENLLIGYDKTKGLFYINREKAGNSDFSKDFKGIHTAPIVLKGSEIDMHLIIDAASVELFAGNGKIAMTEIFFPTESFSGIRLFSNNGGVQLSSGKAYKLTSIWKSVN